MASYNENVDLNSYPVPAKYDQRGRTSMFTNSAGQALKPFPYWLENVVPIARGVKSVSWNQREEIAAPQTKGIPANLYRFPSGNLGTQLGLLTNGEFYLYNPTTAQWKKEEDYAEPDRIPTHTYIRQDSLLYFPDKGVVKVNPEGGLTTLALTWGDNVTPPTGVKGISSCSGYLLMYTKDTIYWSSPLDYKVFALQSGGVSTGAGSTKVQGLLGDIVEVVPVAGGAVVYTNKCAFAMQYTTNALVPFAFSQIPECSGVQYQWHIAPNEDMSAHFIWATSGMQLVALNQAQAVFPEFTEFFAKDELQELSRNQIIRIKTQVSIKLGYLGNGTLCISIGPRDSYFHYCWIYDVNLKRWGRISFPHWHVAPYVNANHTVSMSYSYLLSKGTTVAQLRGATYESLRGDIRYNSEQPLERALFGIDGKLYHSDWAEVSNGANARVIIGDFRLTFNRDIEVNEIILDASDATPEVSCYDQLGNEFRFIQDSYTQNRFVERAAGSYVTVAVKGDFELSAVVVGMVSGGRTR